MTCLFVRSGELPSREALDQWLALLSPNYSVLEPAIVISASGRRGASEDFRGIAQNIMDLREVEIDELRLDWTDGSLQFAASNGGYRWVSHALSGRFAPTLDRGLQGSFLDKLEMHDKPAFWRTPAELARFAPRGKQRHGGLPALIRQFTKGPHVVAWWFVTPG